MRATPAPLELYRHFKGNLYQVKCIAKHSETGEKMVVYQAMYGDYTIYVRSLDMFMEEVDTGKYPDAKQKYRFEKMEGDATDTTVAAHAPQAVRPEKNTEHVKAPSSASSGKSASGENTSEGADAASEGFVDPRVIEFLDARTYEEKLTVLASMRGNITNDMLNIMAVSEDIEIKPGSIEDRYEELKSCLVTLDHFECNRLR